MVDFQLTRARRAGKRQVERHFRMEIDPFNPFGAEPVYDPLPNRQVERLFLRARLLDVEN